MFPSKYRENSENSTGLLFMRSYNKWHFEIKNELKKLNITHPQFVVLTSLAYLLQKEKEVTQIMISKISGIDVMTVSQIITLLEKNGFIKRNHHSKDTRAKSVFLTSKGEKMVEKAVPLVEEIDEKFFSILGKEKVLFRNCLKKL
ncbi:MarR family transcriptional regulator [Leptotrichia sp. OH3620_COT-345]|uniref:MarR family winged helix-turn-helix transcriptional regulator n=1 Tax=Leptotrichia sp. OH3620_COT-345 TaxID=2491048 RepID=UPI000F6495EE|nr:MarR family transcriptional regulator [Leptotrichia sp. OH3620_COT-345]RRD38764.1 MarR family transcriptional regulator [Leptotrichia sp. OH3620_COT-345]